MVRRSHLNWRVLHIVVAGISAFSTFQNCLETVEQAPISGTPSCSQWLRQSWIEPGIFMFDDFIVYHQNVRVCFPSQLSTNCPRDLSLPSCLPLACVEWWSYVLLNYLIKAWVSIWLIRAFLLSFWARSYSGPWPDNFFPCLPSLSFFIISFSIGIFKKHCYFCVMYICRYAHVFCAAQNWIHSRCSLY